MVLNTSKHGNVDALSRLRPKGQCNNFHVVAWLEELACGGCTYCTKAQENWGSFLNTMDDVVPLVTIAKGSTPMAMETRTILGIHNSLQ